MASPAGRLILRGWAPFALLVLLALPACRRDAPRPAAVDSAMKPTGSPDSNQAASARIAEIIRTQAARLMAIPGVHGVAEGRTDDGRPCILLLVEDPHAPAVKSIPGELESFPVRFSLTDSIRAMDQGHKP